MIHADRNITEVADRFSARQSGVRGQSLLVVSSDELEAIVERAVANALATFKAQLATPAQTEPQTNTSHLPPFLTVARLADLLGIDRRTVRRKELRGEIPLGIKLSGMKRWKTDEILAFLDSKRDVKNTSPKGAVTP